MAKIYGIVSTKGGVGKTSLTANLGGILADMGQRTLLIDGDFQQTLSSYYRISQRAKHGLSTFIRTVSPVDCISRTDIDNLDIILSDDPKAKLTDWIKESANNIYYLAAAIKKINDSYDYVLIDSQGARGLLQQSIILASDALISPIVPEVLESREFMRGTIQLLKDMEPPPGITIPMPNIPPLLGLIYRQERTVQSVRIANAIRKEFYNETQGKISILDTFVPHITAYKKASALQLPVHRVEPTRTGPTASARDTFLALVHEMLPHLSDVTPSWPDMAGGKEDQTHAAAGA
jgi:chromosome partitioning related protein ParA